MEENSYTRKITVIAFGSWKTKQNLMQLIKKKTKHHFVPILYAVKDKSRASTWITWAFELLHLRGTTSQVRPPHPLQHRPVPSSQRCLHQSNTEKPCWWDQNAFSCIFPSILQHTLPHSYFLLLSILETHTKSINVSTKWFLTNQFSFVSENFITDRITYLLVFAHSFAQFLAKPGTISSDVSSLFNDHKSLASKGLR